jgi:hypothetical protein
VHCVGLFAGVTREFIAGVLTVLSNRVGVLGIEVRALRAVSFTGKGPQWASALDGLIFQVRFNFSFVDTLPVGSGLVKARLSGRCKCTRLAGFGHFVSSSLSVVEKLRLVSQFVFNYRVRLESGALN